MADVRSLAEKEVMLTEMPMGRRYLSSKRVSPSAATFSQMMLMSGKPASCVHACLCSVRVSREHQLPLP